MSKLLRRPPPIVAVFLNAVLGLVLVPMALVALYALVLFVFKVPAPPLRWLIGTASIPLAFVAALGAASGFAVGAVLLWATPRNGKVWRVLASIMAVFAICMPVALAASRFYWQSQTGFGMAAAVVSFGACGAAMAFALARAVRRLGATPMLAPGGIALLGGALASLGLGATLLLSRLEPLEFLPALWLGLVTYFCLKPLPEPGPDGALTSRGR